MSLTHAVVWIDHQRAQVLHLDVAQVHALGVKAHTHHTRQNGSSVRTEHEFFGEVCDKLAGISEVLITGGHTAQSDFKHYAAKHRPAIAALIVGYETVDHPNENQLVAMARKYFLKHDGVAGASTPS